MGRLGEPSDGCDWRIQLRTLTQIVTKKAAGHN